MTDNLTNNPAAYLSELQRIEREQELAKLRTLSLEFAGVLDFFPKLREELEAFHHADGIAFDGLADRLRPILKQAAGIQFEIEHLPAKLHNTLEMQAFLQQVKKIISLQSVNRLEVQFQGVCQDIRQRFEKEKLEAQRKAKEEAERQAKEKAEKKAEAERREIEEAERQARKKAEAERLAKKEAKEKWNAEYRVREEAERQAKEKAEAERCVREKAELQFEIEQLSTDLRNAPEMQAFLQQVNKITNLESVNRLKAQFTGVCQDIRQRLEKEKREADRQVWEEKKRQSTEKAGAERQAKEKAEAEHKAREEVERRAREEAERQAKEEYECQFKNRINKCNKGLFIFVIGLVTILFVFLGDIEDGITMFVPIFSGMFWGYAMSKKDNDFGLLPGGFVGLVTVVIVAVLIDLLSISGDEGHSFIRLVLGIVSGIFIAYSLKFLGACEYWVRKDFGVD